MVLGWLRRVTARGRPGLRRHQERVQLTRPERSAGPRQRHSFGATATPTSGTFCHPNESTCHPRSSHSRPPTPPSAPNLLSVSAGLSVLDTTEGEPSQRFAFRGGFPLTWRVCFQGSWVLEALSELLSPLCGAGGALCS